MPYFISSTNTHLWSKRALVYHQLLNDELMASKSYDQVLSLLRVIRMPQLEENRQSHYARSIVLFSQITALGGIPHMSNNLLWPLKVSDDCRERLIKINDLLLELQAGEDHTLTDYYQALVQLDAEGRAFIENTLLPEQEQVREVISDLCQDTNEIVLLKEVL